jgi:cytochrome c2
MFDTMTLTKTAGALCGSLLIFLLGSWAAELIYTSGGHGEDHAQGYVVDTGEDETEEETTEESPDLAQMFASAEPSKGERVFNQCRACHMIEDGENGVGPHLYGVVGRDVGSVDGFSYSGALSEAADAWTAEELNAFLESPADYAPGTSMGYSGLSNVEDRVNVIAYLDETDGESNIEIAAAASDASEGTGSEDASDSAAEKEGTEDGAAADDGRDEAAENGADDVATEEDSADSADEGVTDEAATDAADESATEDAGADSTEEAAADSTEDAATEVAASEEAAADDASEFETLVASADVGAGERLYRQCQACHQLETERNGVGPHLVGIVGREIAAVDGFRYSDALAGLDGNWTLDELSAWIENPDDYASGNKMGYRGLADEQERANLMAYLQSVQN